MINFKDSTKELLRQVEELFDTKFAGEGASYSLQLKNLKDNSKIHVEVIPESEEGEGGSYLISVYTNNCHLQLQSCRKFIVSKMLEEAIFVSETEDKISGLIISKQGDCALYSNVDKKLLSSDFADLNSEKLLSAVALSVMESA
ncbi:MAG: hypothetical protein KDC73_12470 [Ignavibacteriae bacterium]|nr:hypothetical protein [Ignavibacteriota bacterium]MCB9243345.1 hypothetical protein [Ignavibacteriales bacterium]